MQRLTNKVALITGGTSGIGLATAQLFADEGAQVIVTGRNEETLAEARRALQGKAEVVSSDAGDPAKVKALVEGIRARHGRIDVLFLNAGIARFASIAETTEALALEQMQVNYFGPLALLRESLPLLGKGASVILTTSIVTERGMPATGSYAASKSALLSLAKVAARELAPKGVRVNTVSPGPIATPIFGKTGLTAQQQESLLAERAQSVPLGRVGTAHEVASAVLFLASDEAAFVTGQDFGVDGGLRVA